MNKKYIKLIGAVVVLALLVYCLMLALNSKKQVPLSSGGITGPALNIHTSSGTVPVKDFTQNPVEKVGQTTAVNESDTYSIVYFDEDKSFSITLLSQPVRQVRIAAEQAFLANLGVSRDDACKLKVSLMVPAAVDQTLAGQDYGLSFCPNGRQF